MELALFYILILVCNIIQGITGFAGTILAMPFAIMLVGYEVAKPILNVLGILSGVYVFSNNYKYVNWKELKKIVIIMAIGIFGGIFVKGLFVGKESILYKLLGIFIITLAVKGIKKFFFDKPNEEAEAVMVSEETQEKKASSGMLVFAGIVHGIFVSGGPILIGYLSSIIKDKTAFRATISTVWIFLNSIIFFDDIRVGFFTPQLIMYQFISIPFLFIGMLIGTKLYHKMSQETFMKITYVLLFISGLSLIVK